MKQVKVIIIGNGDRAHCYCKYALSHPDALQVVGIVDPDEMKLEQGAKEYGVKKEMLFKSVDDLCAFHDKNGKLCDGIVNTTMDEYHYQTAMPLLKRGYNMLLEKPVVNNAEQLYDIKKTAEENGCLLMVCHVLRYTPFYFAIKEVVISGEIGEIMHIETCENVGVAHSSNSYIRGKWNSKEKCGSSMLLAKCCHDLDMLCWLNNTTSPVKVSSMGGRNFIVPEKAPVDATERCLNGCPHLSDCIYNAKSIYVDNDRYPYYSWQCLGDYENKTKQEKVDSLKTFNPHGVCAFKTGSDLVDHQALVLQFENGSTATHSMIQGAMLPTRKIRIMGTKGEIEGSIEESKFVVRTFNYKTAKYKKRKVNVKRYIPKDDHHAGGDEGIIKDYISMLNGEKTSISCTKIQDSIYSHLCVYAADKSMENNTVEEIKL